MSYTISPVIEEKVTYEVQYRKTHEDNTVSQWLPTDSILYNSIEVAIRWMDGMVNEYGEDNEEYRTIQRTESVALVVREES